MSSLVAQVRTKSGASVTEASDARIIECLNAAAVRADALEVEWLQYPDGTHTRRGRIPLGKYMVEATATASSVTPLALHDEAGTTIAALSVDQLGNVTTSAPSGDLPTAYATGSAFDIFAAAAAVVGDRIALVATSYDFTRGDQKFTRSQMLTGLRELEKDLRRQRVPRRRGETMMRDQQKPC